MLNWTERIIRMRKEVPEIGNSVVFVHNLSDSPREVAFSVPGGGEDARSLVNLLSEDHSRADAQGKHHLLLEAYGYRWYRARRRAT